METEPKRRNSIGATILSLSDAYKALVQAVLEHPDREALRSRANEIQREIEKQGTQRERVARRKGE